MGEILRKIDLNIGDDIENKERMANSCSRDVEGLRYRKVSFAIVVRDVSIKDGKEVVLKPTNLNSFVNENVKPLSGDNEEHGREGHPWRKPQNIVNSNGMIIINKNGDERTSCTNTFNDLTITKLY